MQGYQYVEAYGPPYVRGIEDVTWPSSQVEAIQNASYWHDGLLPYCTDAPACQPPEEAYLHLGIPDWLWGPEWNLDPQAGYTPQITLQHYDYLAPAYARAASSLHIHTVPCTPDTPECALPFDSASASPASPCGPLWSDLELPQTPPQLLAEPGLLATIPPARACTPPPLPHRRAIRLAPLPARAPSQNPVPIPALPAARKPRRVTRPIQPLACFFCRRRKIACARGDGEHTCEPCARRDLECEYPRESFRGRRSHSASARTSAVHVHGPR